MCNYTIVIYLLSLISITTIITNISTFFFPNAAVSVFPINITVFKNVKLIINQMLTSK